MKDYTLMPSHRFSTALIMFSFLSFSCSASAIQRDGVTASIGGFYANIDSSIGSTLVGENGDILGGHASFESDLNLEDATIQPALDVLWRFKQNHSISFHYFNLNREGSSVKVVEFPIGENVFKAGAELNTRLNLGLSQMKYGYSFYQKEVAEWGVTGGLHIINLDLAFSGYTDNSINTSGPNEVFSESGFESNVPLPNIGTYYHHTVAKDFMILLNAQYFDISVDVLDARLISLEAGVDYLPTPNFSLYAGLSYYDVDAEYIQDIKQGLGKVDIDWDIALIYWGPKISIGYHF